MFEELQDLAPSGGTLAGNSISQWRDSPWENYYECMLIGALLGIENIGGGNISTMLWPLQLVSKLNDLCSSCVTVVVASW